MSYLHKLDRAVKDLGIVTSTINGIGVNKIALARICDAKSVLQGVRFEMAKAENDKTLAESERDSLLMAIAGTIEGRTLDITGPHEVIQHAVSVIRIMDADIKTNREAEEIPFGAVEQDKEKMQLEQRIAELELQLELKVDECAAKENKLKGIELRCESLIYQMDIVGMVSKSLINKIKEG